MKKFTFTNAATLLIAVAFFAACKKDQPATFDPNFTGIYFSTDSMNYSFGVTPIEITSHLLKVPVKVMGMPDTKDRVFSVEIGKERTTAVEGVHYKLTGDLVVPKDSVNGYIPLEILRADLGEDDFKIHFKLIEKDGFTPVDYPNTHIIVVFNNRVEPPNWTDWMGNKTWPEYQLGAWHPLKYVKLIELFRGLEQILPETYKAMVAQYGPDLAHVEFGWPYDYQNVMNKYIQVPLYQYFVEQHPELGVSIPRPTGY